MGWVFLEVVAALAIAAGLVWWTLPRDPKPRDGTGEAKGKDDPPVN